jgi:DNA-directed RNA polymerase
MSTPIRLARAAAARQLPLTARAGPSRISQRLIHVSACSLRPAAQLAESDDSPSYYETPQMNHAEVAYRRNEPLYPSRQDRITIPSPLPADVINAADYNQAALYPTTGVIDSISMISICLRRPEHIPRAYQIFNQVLLDVKAAPHRMPESEVWARVIEGVASLGEMKPGEETWRTWRGRAAVLASKWEAYCSVPKGTAGLEHDGIKVYQGWLSGLMK